MIPSGQVLDPVDIPVENFSDKPAAKRSRSPSATDPRQSQPLEQVDRRSASPHPGQSPSQGRGMARAPGGGASAPGSLGLGVGDQQADRLTHLAGLDPEQIAGEFDNQLYGNTMVQQEIRSAPGGVSHSRLVRTEFRRSISPVRRRVSSRPPLQAQRRQAEIEAAAAQAVTDARHQEHAVRNEARAALSEMNERANQVVSQQQAQVGAQFQLLKDQASSMLNQFEVNAQFRVEDVQRTEQSAVEDARRSEQSAVQPVRQNSEVAIGWMESEANAAISRERAKTEEEAEKRHRVWVKQQGDVVSSLQTEIGELKAELQRKNDELSSLKGHAEEAATLRQHLQLAKAQIEDSANELVQAKNEMQVGQEEILTEAGQQLTDYQKAVDKVCIAMKTSYEEAHEQDQQKLEAQRRIAEDQHREFRACQRELKVCRE